MSAFLIYDRAPLDTLIARGGADYRAAHLSGRQHAALRGGGAACHQHCPGAADVQGQCLIVASGRRPRSRRTLGGEDRGMARRASKRSPPMSFAPMSSRDARSPDLCLRHFLGSPSSDGGPFFMLGALPRWRAFRWETSSPPRSVGWTRSCQPGDSAWGDVVDHATSPVVLNDTGERYTSSWRISFAGDQNHADREMGQLAGRPVACRPRARTGAEGWRRDRAASSRKRLCRAS